MSKNAGKRRCWRCMTLVNRVSLRRLPAGLWECRSHDNCLRRLAEALRTKAAA